jgi:hypothetical protein
MTPAPDNTAGVDRIIQVLDLPWKGQSRHGGNPELAPTDPGPGRRRHAGELIRRIRDGDDVMMETIVVPLRADLKRPLRW